MSNKIKSSNMEIGNYVNIHPDVEILCPNLKIGNNVYIGKGSKISCEYLEIGDDNFFQGDVWIEGALDSLENRVKIGSRNLICQGTRINSNYSVEIGSHVGIGQNVRIWSHGYFLDRLKGYPYNNGPIKIGNNVWLTEGSVVLPNTTIGNDVIIANNTLINKDIPSGCFAAGQPVEIKKENIYPINLSYTEKRRIIEDVVEKYIPLMEKKGFKRNLDVDGLKIYFDKRGDNEVIFDCNNMRFKGNIDKYGEDFRDHLRRNSIKFFNGTPFKSILPLSFRELMEEKE